MMLTSLLPSRAPQATALAGVRTTARTSAQISAQAIASNTARVAALLVLGLARQASAQGFEQINTTVTNVQEILILISIAVVTIAIIWAGFRMIFQAARLADVANILVGGTLVGGAAAFASFIVTPA